MNGRRLTGQLRDVELFSSLTDQELQQLMPVIHVKDFKKGETILYEEHSNDFMYIILAGEVKVSQTTGGGKEIILAIHRSGEFFGEMSLLDGKTVPARVSATRNSTIAVISKNEFHAVLLGQRKLVENLIQILCSRLREAHAWIQMLNFNSASQRIRMLLLIVAEKHGERFEGGIRLKVRLTHQDIANMTGMSRETVTRVFEKWRKEGEVSVVDRAILLSEAFCRDMACRS